MVTLALDAQALAGVRFTTSPLWEIGLSALVLRRPSPGPVHAAWARSVRAGADPRLLDRVCALTAGEGFVLDSLTPSGAHPASGRGLAVTLDDELDHLHALDPNVVARDLAALAGANRNRGGAVHDWVRTLAGAGAREALAALDPVLRAYWAVAVAPHWDRFARLVDDDATRHARTAAHHGAGAMLEDLHPRIRFTGTALDIPGACEASLESADPRHGVLLVPSAFAWPDVHVQPNAPHRPAIAYGVRGLATLWDGEDSGLEPAQHLARLLGAGRARVLAALAVPSTTHELAHDLSLAPSTVSEHLQALAASGLTASNRDGRAVRYRLTDLGRDLTQA